MFPSSAATVKAALRSANRLRTWVPFTVTPPMEMESTMSESLRVGAPNQVLALPEKSASGNWDKNVDLNSSWEKVAML